MPLQLQNVEGGTTCQLPVGNWVSLLTSIYPLSVESIQTVEEFSDVNAHFSLYYASDIVDLQNLAKTNAVIDGVLIVK